MDLNLEFTSHILKNKEDLLTILSKNYDFNLIDFTVKGFSPIRATCLCILEFYKTYSTLITIEQVESYVTNICLKQDQAKLILEYFKQVFDYSSTANFDFILDNIRKEFGLYTIRNTLLDSTTSLDAQDLSSTIDTLQKGLNKINLLDNTEVVEGDLALSLDAFYDKYRRVQQGEITVGLPTGFPTFDKSTGGLKSGELDIVIGASNDGKSVCLINIAHHLYLQGKNVLYFSVELPKEQIIRRFLSLAANINIDRFRDGILTADENDRLIKVMNEFKQRSNLFYIVDDPTCTAESVRAKFEELNSKNKIDLIIIDYLGIMKSKKVSEQKWETLGQLALDLRHIARTYNIPVLTAQQVRTEAIRNTKNPVYNMTDIANSALVFHHADTILSIKTKDPTASLQGLSIIDISAATVKVRDGNKCSFDIQAMFTNMRMIEMRNSFGTGDM